MNAIRVLLVSETLLMGNLIGSVLNDDPEIQVLASVTTLEEAMQKASLVNVALVSTGLPGRDSLRLTQALNEHRPDLPVLMLGLAESEAEILQYVEAGASGYVLKDDSVQELVRNIHAACEGKALVSPQIAGALVARVTELAQMSGELASAPGSFDLTPREQEVLELLNQGLTNQEIADTLFIALGTVKLHVHSILQKLNVSSRHDAAAYWAIVGDD